MQFELECSRWRSGAEWACPRADPRTNKGVGSLWSFYGCVTFLLTFVSRRDLLRAGAIAGAIAGATAGATAGAAHQKWRLPLTSFLRRLQLSYAGCAGDDGEHFDQNTHSIHYSVLFPGCFSCSFPAGTKILVQIFDVEFAHVRSIVLRSGVAA